MKLNVDNLLYQLATEWLDTILNKPVEAHVYLNPDDIEYENETNNIAATLEDEMMMVMTLRKNKQRLFISGTSDTPAKKKAKYESNRIMFTHPETGERNVMTYHYTIWWQNYCANPRPNSRSWAQHF